MTAALLLLATLPTGDNPYSREVRAALIEARRLGPAAPLVRYLTMFNLEEKQKDELWRKAIDYYGNSTTHAGQFYKVRRVGNLLVLPAFDWGVHWLEAWENLANTDPHFHVQVEVVVGQKDAKRFFKQDGKEKAGWYKIDVNKPGRIPALAPWTGEAHAELVALTNTAVPIVRADFFVERAFIQADRRGDGYYSFAGIKTVADFDKLIGFDRRQAEEREMQVAAIVSRSGVARFPRQVFIEGALTGARSETRDVTDDNLDARNGIRQLDGDYKFQALEIYGFNSVGLFLYVAANEKGELQDSVPDKLASDTTAPGNDHRIHPFKSCVVCHVEGYRDVRDMARKLYSGPVRLNVADPVKAHRLAGLYLGDFQTPFDEANAKYARNLKRLTGWTPDECAKAIGEVWKFAVERDFLPADVAGELGIDEKVYLSKLRAYAKANQLSDPVLAMHLSDPPLAIRSDDVEQLYPLIVPVVLGVPK